jgi:O-antigen ligase
MRTESRAHDRLRVFLYAAFLLVVIQLPVEVPRPLFSVGPLVFTNLETTVGIMLAGLAAYGLLKARTRSLPRSNLGSPDLAVGIWVLSLFLSAALAPDLRAHAAKFALRGGAIASLYVASRVLHGAGGEGERRMRITAGTLAALGGVVSLLGLLEGMKEHSIEPILSIFRTVPTLTADGFLRMTATFSHANQTAGFLTMILPLATALALDARGPRRLAWTAATALVFWGLLSTLSRSGVVAGILATFLVLALGVRARKTRSTAALLMVVLLLLGGVRWAGDAPFRSRFGGRPVASPFAARYEAPEALTLPAGARARVTVGAQNLGSIPWNRGGFAPVSLSYHLIRMRDETPVIFDGPRTPAPKTVRPGVSVLFPAEFRAPVEEGRFLLLWDLVRERVSWFSWAGVPPGMTRVTVLPAGAASTAIDDRWPESTMERLPQAAAKVEGRVEWSEAPRSTLWKIAFDRFRRRPFFGWGADTFRLRYAESLGPGHWDPRIHANSLYLELLATTGIMGLLSWLWMLLTLVRRAPWRGWGERVGPGDEPGSILILAAGAGLLAFSAHGLLDSFLEFYGIMGVFWILAGTVAAPAAGSGRALDATHPGV